MTLATAKDCPANTQTAMGCIGRPTAGAQGRQDGPQQVLSGADRMRAAWARSKSSGRTKLRLRSLGAHRSKLGRDLSAQLFVLEREGLEKTGCRGVGPAAVGVGPVVVPAGGLRGCHPRGFSRAGIWSMISAREGCMMEPLAGIAVEIPENVQRGEAARLFPVLSENSREGRAVSVLLSSLSVVDALADALLRPIGKPIGSQGDRSRAPGVSRRVARRGGQVAGHAIGAGALNGSGRARDGLQ